MLLFQNNFQVMKSLTDIDGEVTEDTNQVIIKGYFHQKNKVIWPGTALATNCMR